MQFGDVFVMGLGDVMASGMELKLELEGEGGEGRQRRRSGDDARDGACAGVRDGARDCVLGLGGMIRNGPEYTLPENGGHVLFWRVIPTNIYERQYRNLRTSRATCENI
jgi:hypothetical protein